jgi:hypothetical protein
MTRVTTEALDAADKMAGVEHWHERDVITAEIYKHALAHMIQKHEPELIAESFDARTRREFGEFYPFRDMTVGFTSNLEAYRKFIRKYQDEAK